MRGKEHSLQTIIKEELLRQSIKTEHERAFLSAVIRGAGEISLSLKGYGLSIVSESLDLINKCILIIKNRYDIEATTTTKIQKNIGMREISLYKMQIPSELAQMVLEDMLIVSGYNFVKGIPSSFLPDTESKKAYLKGIYLSCGYVSAPKDKTAKDFDGKKGYHMEFSLNSDLVVDDFTKLLSWLCGFEMKTVRRRKETPSLYIKSAQHISDILAAMGASKGVMALQEIMATRAMRNHLNRGNNFIIANIDKSVMAADRQLKAIEKIDNVMGLKNLDKSLREAAYLRINNPDATLTEIAMIMGSVSLKSRINHRMRKIIEIANKL
ncbi:MAG: DNA-binding protein WhiA [Bacillota bacterium]